MLAGDQRDGSDQQGDGEDDYARVFAAAGHGVSIIPACHILTLVRGLRQFSVDPRIARSQSGLAYADAGRSACARWAIAWLVDMAVEDVGDLADLLA